jgi:hypothetical protein
MGIADGQWHSFGAARSATGSTLTANGRFAGERGSFGGGFRGFGGYGYRGFGYGWGGCWGCGWGFGWGLGWGFGWDPFWAWPPYGYGLWWGDYGYLYPYAY